LAKETLKKRETVVPAKARTHFCREIGPPLSRGRLLQIFPKGTVALILLALCFPAWGQATRAEMSCKFTGTDFVYDCVIRLTPARPGVEITVGADMPSMPMAHNVKPVKARPGKAPGEYRATLDLDMTGEWTVKLRLSGAVRDVLVLHHVFTESGTAPRK
jgi:hypothetical protein